VLDLIRPFQRRYQKQFGTRLVFASDEFYTKAGEPSPPAAFYGDFPQIENGVGMIADFMRNASRVRLPSRVQPQKVTVVTGMSFSGILKNVLKRFESVQGALVRQVNVKNRFFGPTVTVSGLITGGDIVKALKGRHLGDKVMIPSNALKEDEDVFLDDMHLDHLSRILKVKAVKVGSFQDAVKLLKGERSDG